MLSQVDYDGLCGNQSSGGPWELRVTPHALAAGESPNRHLLIWAFTGTLALALYRSVTMLPIECPEPFSGWRGSVLLLGCCGGLARLSAQLLSWAHDLTDEPRLILGLCATAIFIMAAYLLFPLGEARNHWPMPLYGCSVWGPIWFWRLSGLGIRPAASAKQPLPKIVELVHGILMDSIICDADHIRIERRQDGSIVAFRQGGGIFCDRYHLPVELHELVVRRIKLMAGVLFADPRVPQKGRFRITAVINQRPGEFAFIISSVPAESGEGVLLQRTESHWASSGRSGSTASGQADAEPPPRVGFRVLGERVVLFRKRQRRRRTMR